MSEAEVLQVEIRDRIAVLTLNSPPVNALSRELLENLRNTFLKLGKNKELRAVVLTGAGEKAFCAGMDTQCDFNMPKGGIGSYGQHVMTTIEQCPLPVIAAINGFALGGGLELALACDIRIATEEAKLGLVEANLGLIAGWGGMTRLPLIVGESNAKLMFYPAAKLTAQEAKEIGLVQKVVPKEQLMDAAMELAQLIASKAPLSVMSAKRIIHATRQAAFGAGQFAESEQNNIVSASKDVGEGMRALREKRAPDFKNE